MWSLLQVLPLVMHWSWRSCCIKPLTEDHTLFLVCFHHVGLGVDLLGVSLLYFVAVNPAVNLAACSSCAVNTPGYKVSVCRLEGLSVRVEEHRGCGTEQWKRY